jgi:hypothetical protein
LLTGRPRPAGTEIAMAVVVCGDPWMSYVA